MDDIESYTVEEQGNPTEAPEPVSARKPPAAPRKGRSKKRAAGSAGSRDSALDNHTNGTADTVSVSSAQISGRGEEAMTDMFHIDGAGFDVTLSLRQEKIVWESMNPGK